MQDKLPKVAILLAAYNGEQWINAQLDSIWLQQDVTLDIFVSLDASHDSTLSLLTDLKCNNSNLFILKI